MNAADHYNSIIIYMDVFVNLCTKSLLYVCHAVYNSLNFKYTEEQKR